MNLEVITPTQFPGVLTIYRSELMGATVLLLQVEGVTFTRTTGTIGSLQFGFDTTTGGITFSNSPDYGQQRKVNIIYKY